MAARPDWLSGRRFKVNLQTARIPFCNHGCDTDLFGVFVPFVPVGVQDLLGHAVAVEGFVEGLFHGQL